MGVPKFSGERVTIGSARTARDAVLVATGRLGGSFPGPVVGHRAFDREDAAVVVGDDQEERLGRVGVLGDEGGGGIPPPPASGSGASGRSRTEGQP